MVLMTDESASLVDTGADRLMTIGVFARRSRLSLRALRLYDEQGLLVPERVDPANGHRWYRESQLFTARLIVLLRQLEMPLAQVAEVIAAPGEEGAELLADYWDGIERQITGRRRLVELLRTSLSGGRERFGEYQIREREVAECTVLTARRHLHTPDLEAWLVPTKRRLLATAEQYGGPTAGLLVIFHGEVSHDSDGPVEVCVPIDPGSLSGGAQTETDQQIRIEAAHREAYVTVTKAQFEAPQIMSAYDAVRRWSELNGRVVVGPGREVFCPGVDPHSAALTELVCDVAYPIR
jgi:DNA-binding transcriptional MerR regulator